MEIKCNVISATIEHRRDPRIVMSINSEEAGKVRDQINREIPEPQEPNDDDIVMTDNECIKINVFRDGELEFFLQTVAYRHVILAGMKRDGSRFGDSVQVYNNKKITWGEFKDLLHGDRTDAVKILATKREY